MIDPEIQLSPNPLVRFLRKPAAEFTRDDLIKYIENNGIEMVNFRYAAEDGKLKTLNFIIHNKKYLESILTAGERVDGSSLFSYIEAESSDLYVIPKYRAAFVNPFTEIPSIDLFCSFYNNQGRPLDSSPEYVLQKAYADFTRSTGLQFKALGELEYYVNSKKDLRYPLIDQKGYHQSRPFAKFEILRTEALRLIAMAGGRIKYGHSEVGSFSTGQEDFEQHEIEFLPAEPEEAANQLVLAKWLLRMLSYRYGVEVSFAPKILEGKAGSGLHIHMMLEKNGENQMVAQGKLSPMAKKMIAGILDLADALTAFGNTVPTSYLRLVPHQEAPTCICWGDRNRSVLVRVPLGWIGANDMIQDANPGEAPAKVESDSKQTVEFRAPDGSADVYHLLAGLIVAAKHGLTMLNSLAKAEQLYVAPGYFKKNGPEAQKCLAQLPGSCWESAQRLEEKREYFEKEGIFPAGTINHFIKKLRAYDDKDLSEKLYGNREEIHKLVMQYLHCM
jgi:glutamine synthetase